MGRAVPGWKPLYEFHCHFWTLGIENKNDYGEGVGETVSLDDFEHQFGTELRDAFGDHIIAPVQNRIEAYKYVHILCMLMHEYDPVRKEAVRISTEMSKMGEYTVRVNNVQAFVNRLFDKVYGD